MPSFAASFKRMRLHLGLNQDEMAERLSTTRRTIVRWENGGARPLASDHERLFRSLDGVHHELLRQMAVALPYALPPLPGELAAIRDQLNARVYALSEVHDVSPRRLRHAALALLEHGAQLGLSLDQLRGFLGQTAPRV